MSELVFIKYCSLREDMYKHIDRMNRMVEKLGSMETKLDDYLAIEVLFASIKVDQLQPVTAAIKKFSDTDINWKNVKSRISEK